MPPKRRLRDASRYNERSERRQAFGATECAPGSDLSSWPEVARETGCVTSVGWLADGTEASLRCGLAFGAPELADLPMTINPRYAATDPLWWSSSAVIDGRFVVKFAWSEIRATRLWRDGVVLAPLARRVPPLPVPRAGGAEPVAGAGRDPAGSRRAAELGVGSAPHRRRDDLRSGAIRPVPGATPQ